MKQTIFKQFAARRTCDGRIAKFVLFFVNEEN